MSKDVKRWTAVKIAFMCEKLGGFRPDAEFIQAPEHDRIVAELRAEVERLKNERKVQEFRIQSHEPVMEQLDLDLQRTLRRNVKLSETIARQARVIEKLKEQRNAVIKAANQDGLEYGNPKNWDKELAAIERAERENEP